MERLLPASSTLPMSMYHLKIRLDCANCRAVSLSLTEVPKKSFSSYSPVATSPDLGHKTTEWSQG